MLKSASKIRPRKKETDVNASPSASLSSSVGTKAVKKHTKTQENRGDHINMVQLDSEKSTICTVYDLTPDTEQKRINIVVRSHSTVEKVFSNITTQYHYDAFDLILQPADKETPLVHLNACKPTLLFDVSGFSPADKNTLVILPPGVWDDNVTKRFELGKTLKKKGISNGICNKTTPKKEPIPEPLQTPTPTPAPEPIPESNGLENNEIIHNNNNNDMLTTTTNNNDNNNTITNHTSNCQMDEEDDEPLLADEILPCTTSGPIKLNTWSDPEPLSDDDLALGASASPTETEPYSDALLRLSSSSRSPNSKFDNIDYMYEHKAKTNVDLDCSPLPFKVLPSSASSTTTTTTTASAVPLTSTITGGANKYVGLVNQAMTCYLNSLLQALYMTPEFRNALYRWEFDNDNEAKNIPYQLQKLFLNLQTSKKSAVETTDLTRSFGWDSTEAWQQHDIQELCRVMFDALEHKFKNTKQMNLISNLYEGKMIDYVKCLECNTEKTRADTFLDIPLPVRPFGSVVAYGSIEEALRAFVQPETLDGNNQYFCEKCNKKCDAHKGLKFKNFPYILTLHLKRFDFDYQTMHRIKLNDKVTFPQMLNLNSFINPADAQSGSSAEGASTTGNGYVLNGATTTIDDCSTTDSGSAMEEDNCSSGIATTASSSQHENDMNDEDEGIDMSTSTDHRVSSNASVEQRLSHESGPYLYELFAIMIHSGSASGGHYYAYIKEFENNEWYCFNDQSVSPITEEDIQKSFGGGSSKAYYSSVYSSSTNAYMLMYRQIDTQRNEHAMKADDLPEHINTLLPKLHMEEETRGSRSSRHGVTVSDLAVQELIKPRIHFYNPELKKMKFTRVYVSSFNLNTLLESAYQMLNVEKFAPLSQCRLVAYDSAAEEILQSFEHITDPSSAALRNTVEGTLEFLLEYRAEGQEFEVYQADSGATWNVYMVNMSTMEMDGPFFVHSPAHECNEALLHSIAVRLHVKESEMLLATLPKKKAFVAYDPSPTKEAQERLQELARAQFRHLTYIYLNVPNTEPSALEIMGIPPVETQTPAIEVSADVVDAVHMNSHAAHLSPSIGDVAPTLKHASSSSNEHMRRESPLPPAPAQESNSEDSSLSDGDRTLVESINNRYGVDSQISSNSPSPYLSSPEDESYNKTQSIKNAIFETFYMQPDSTVDTTAQTPSSALQFFHAIKIDTVDSCTTSSSHQSCLDTSDEIARKPTHAYKIIVDSHMKMTAFTQHIETLIGVPSNYFKIQRKYDSSDPITLIFLNPGETLNVELGKVLQPDEFKAKISYMRLSELDNDTGKLPCICECVFNGSMTVADARKELITKLHRIDPKYKTLTLENCRLWLKGGRNLVKILSDDETLGSDMRSTVTTEFLVQECEEGVNPQPSEDSLTIFVRRWDADKLQLGNFQELTLEKDSEIRAELAKICDIPQEQIGYNKINSSFPCMNISLLSINSTMNWFSIPATMDKYPLTTTLNGNIYFYKDVTKAAKEPTTEERRELNAKEKARLDRLGCMSTSLYSPRRERALKIYLDSPQSNTTTTPILSSSTATTTTATTSTAAKNVNA